MKNKRPFEGVKFPPAATIARLSAPPAAYQSQTSSRLRRRKPANRRSLPLRSLANLNKLQAMKPMVGSAGMRRSHFRSTRCITVSPFPPDLAASTRREDLLPLEEPRSDKQRTIKE